MVECVVVFLSYAIVFFLAGLTYNSEKYKKFDSFLQTKIRQLVIPYFVFAIVTWAWNVGKQLISVLEGSLFDWWLFLQQTFGIVLQIRTTNYSIGVWFIPCIFCAFIILFFLKRIAGKNKLFLLALATVSLLLGYLYCTYIDIKLPWGIDAAFIAVFFMVVGNIFRDKLRMDFMPNRWTLALGVGSGVLSILFTILNYRILGRTVGMWSNNYGNLFYFLGGAFCGITLTVIVAQFVNFSVVQKIGQNSIFYYGMHTLVLQALYYIVMHIPGLSLNVFAMAVSTCMVIATLLILKLMYPYYELFSKRVR